MNFYLKSLCRPRAGMAKILLVMRLIIVLLTTAILQVSASGYAQKITLSERNASLEQVLKKIKTQSGYNVVYASESLKDANKVSLQFNGLELETALEQIFKNQKLTYELKDKTIVIKEKEPSFLDNLVARFATIDVRGVVVDGETGQALAGASVKVKGSSKATTTSNDGAFYLPGLDEKDVIVVSFIGYVTQELRAKKDLGEIRMVMASSDLNEVEINKGYYTTSRRLNTSSVGKITADDISKQPVSNPLAALYAKVPGLIITQNTGVPGGNFNVQIRGQNSLRNLSGDNGNNPLYIVDGVPFLTKNLDLSSLTGSLYQSSGASRGTSPLNSINPSDIASIEILKDADATAIYGSRGANGVVLIVTKRGKEGKMQTEASVYQGMGKVTRKMDLLSTQQYLEMRMEAIKNDNYTSLLTTNPEFFPDLTAWDQSRYTDWQKELIGGTAKSTDAQLAISGGSINSQYRFGGGYHRETTVFPGDFSDQRGTAHFSMVNASADQKFKSQVSINYALGSTNLLARDLTGDALKLAPNAPTLFNADGSLNFENMTFQDNPLAFTKRPYEAKSNNLIGNAILSYELFPYLTLKTNLGYTNALRKEIAKDPRSSQPVPATSLNRSQFGNSITSSWIVEPQLNFQKSFDALRLNVLVGSTFQSESMEQTYQAAGGFLTEALMDNIGSVPSANVTSTYTGAKYNYTALFARVNFDLQQKYLLNITGRRDGSSRFGPSKQFGNFGAVGLGWIFSEERAIKKAFPFLSYGKLRGSYGTTGSDQIPNYGFLDTYSTTGAGQYNGVSGLAPSRLLNPDFRWESNVKFEATLELGFLDDRISLTTAYYRNQSSNQLVGYALPPTAGFPSVQYNLDATVRNTGVEIELNTLNIKNANFKWSSAINISVPSNKLVSYPNLEGSSYASQYIVGKPLSTQRLYHFLGVNETTGLYEVQDMDLNNAFNRQDQLVQGYTGPEFYGGLQNSLQFKGFQLDFNFQFVKQKLNNYLTSFSQPGFMANQPVEVMNRWQAPGDNTSIQKFTFNDVEYLRTQSSDAIMTDGSFIRLKNASFSYQLPQLFIEKLKIKGAKIFIQGQNLLTITSYKGLDPETQVLRLPPLRVLTAGVQLTL